MAGTGTNDAKRDSERSALSGFRRIWAEEEEAQTRSDVRRLPDDEERQRWTTRTLVELEGDSDRLDFEATLA